MKKVTDDSGTADVSSLYIRIGYHSRNTREECFRTN